MCDSGGVPNDDTLRHWGRTLAERRRLMGFSQEELAEAIHVSKATIAAHEQGRRANLHPSNKIALEQALKWTPGSVDRVMNGGEPEPISEASAQSARVIDLVPGAQAVLDELSLVNDPEERRRLTRAMIEMVRSWRDNGW